MTFYFEKDADDEWLNDCPMSIPDQSSPMIGFVISGLKKLMWPLFIGMQVVKSVLLVLFLPSIIGSVGKIVGKGLPSIQSLSGTFSQFSQPGANTETIDDLEFKDNSFNSDIDADGTVNAAYQYNIPG